MPRARTPEQNQATALTAVSHETERAAQALRDRDITIRFAAEVGCSLREIEAASGIPFKTVSRIIERTTGELA